MRRYDKIRGYCKENWLIGVPMCVTALLFNGLMCLIPQIEGKTIDSLKEGNAYRTLQYVLFFLFLVLFVQFNRFCKRYLVRVFGNKMSLRMRQISFKNLLNKEISYFSSNDVGDILNRNLSDIYDTTEGIRKMTTEVFDTIVLLLGYLISMFLMDYQITLYVLVFILLSIIAAQFMKHFVFKSNKDYKEYLSVNKQLTLTKLNNELYYRGFGVSSNYFKEYDQSLRVLMKKNLKALLFQSSLEPLYLSVAFIGIFFIAYYGGLNVMNEVYEIGTLSAYITTFILVAKKAAKVGKVFNAYQGFKVSWVRCRGYLKNEPIHQEKIEVAEVKMVLSDFGFQYEQGFRLPAFNLTAHKGDLIGICGRVHTGKSTILKALTGMYSYCGSATIGGVEISRLVQDTHQWIGYCATEVAMFSDTLKNNILLGREGDIEKALSVSCLDVDLEELKGLDALMSHSNSNISGGQQKRVQMARTLCTAPSVILLDDPFQSVSPKMAVQMMEGLKRYKDHIIFFVSNNAVLLQQATQIIYLEETKAYLGTYESLLQQEGFLTLMEVK